MYMDTWTRSKSDGFETTSGSLLRTCIRTTTSPVVPHRRGARQALRFSSRVLALAFSCRSGLGGRTRCHIAPLMRKSSAGVGDHHFVDVGYGAWVEVATQLARETTPRARPRPPRRSYEAFGWRQCEAFDRQRTDGETLRHQGVIRCIRHCQRYEDLSHLHAVFTRAHADKGAQDWSLHRFVRAAPQSVQDLSVEFATPPPSSVDPDWMGPSGNYRLPGWKCSYKTPQGELRIARLPQIRSMAFLRGCCWWMGSMVGPPSCSKTARCWRQIYDVCVGVPSHPHQPWGHGCAASWRQAHQREDSARCWDYEHPGSGPKICHYGLVDFLAPDSRRAIRWSARSD